MFAITFWAVGVPAVSAFTLSRLPVSSVSSSRSARTLLQQTSDFGMAQTEEQIIVPMSDWAAIFDCDGIIVDSEQYHRMAYNDAFKEFDIATEWSEEYYRELMNTIGGGIPKMNLHFASNGWPSSSLGPAPSSPEEQKTFLETVQERKTQIYKDYMATGQAQTRPGVVRLIRELAAIPSCKLAVCSASTKDSCLFVLKSLLKEDLDSFDLIMAGDDVEKRKPAPDIYVEAAKRLGIPSNRCIVLEDSEIGVKAAVDAEMRCIAVYTPSTQDQKFEGAMFTLPGFGEKAGKGSLGWDTLADVALRKGVWKETPGLDYDVIERLKARGELPEDA
uniref:Uncharacterized protein n=1 Tax=Chromera velia CCMP2878 TaxID=1169474 RepID=A0A0G4H356_9ALVE|eukprot:Cvel_24519.t1-p1 / transcript=Cvel_24519.t1 / gene=Cvel_24519 / organism=Chromera_velia_CCMP2878 / gene_product=Protein CbbY, putative / transcript_product=Protein CbbY, putative / location=Cvel_scaffold2660:6526-8416(-) / protein_length=331 / sequence_SO=supercontig / SO=protein_coding / is_pseudo=false